MAKNIEKCKCDDINDNKCDNIDEDKFDSVCYECLKESFNFDSIDKKRFKKEVYNGEELLKKLYIDILCKYEICVENKKKLVFYYFNNGTKIKLLSNQLIIYINRNQLKCLGSKQVKEEFKGELKKEFSLPNNIHNYEVNEIKTDNSMKDKLKKGDFDISNIVREKDSTEFTLIKEVNKLRIENIDRRDISVKNNKIYLFQKKIDKNNTCLKKNLEISSITIDIIDNICNIDYFLPIRENHIVMLNSKEDKDDYEKMILKRLRNAVAHMGVKLENVGKDKYICFKDKDKKNDTLIAKIDIKKINQFICELSSLIDKAIK